jgi:hypothetical protein
MENNRLLFEYSKEEPQGLPEILRITPWVNAGGFDVCILASSRKEIDFSHELISGYNRSTATMQA